MAEYYAFYKPYGYLSQFTSEGGHPGLDSFGLPREVYPAGRLDRDSEGLLLLTNDGPFIKKLLDPQNGHERSYYCQLEGIPSAADLSKLEKGVSIKGHKTRPCKVELLKNTPNFPPRNPPIRERKNIPTSWIKLTLTEGKNRQVRRMTASIGFPTLRLVRVSIANLKLSLLNSPGDFVRIDKKDIF